MSHQFTIPLTPTQLSAHTDALKQYGIDLASLTGTLPKQSGVTLSYQYDPEKSQLTLTIESKPMIVTAGFVESKVRGFLKGVLG